MKIIIVVVVIVLVVIAGIAVAAKIIMNKMFPFMIKNVACGLNVKAPISFFIVTYIVILVLYFIINSILVSRLNKFTPAEVLKNRE